MSSLEEVRDAYAHALSELARAVELHRESTEATEQRASSDRHLALEHDEAVESYIQEIRTRADAGYSAALAVVHRLDLQTSEPSEFRVSQEITSDQLVNQVHLLVSMIDEALQEMRSLAAQLEAERRKWWKFW